MLETSDIVQLAIIIILAPTNIYNLIKGVTIKKLVAGEYLPIIKKITYGWAIIWLIGIATWIIFIKPINPLPAFTAWSVFYPLILTVWEYEGYEDNSLWMKIFIKILEKHYGEEGDSECKKD